MRAIIEFRDPVTGRNITASVEAKHRLAYDPTPEEKRQAVIDAANAILLASGLRTLECEK